MGIPSYYKRLIDRYPKLVCKGAALAVTGVRADVLLMDFNCLIYTCVRSERLPAYTAEGREAWEAALLDEVKRYVVRVWEVAGKPREVVLAVDGVVPMAKIRQQRQRRFKSRWMAAAEREAGVRGTESWDTNAITPGTEFMEKLGRALQGLAAMRGRPGTWTVSGADEPGEGEQKVMAWVRERADALAGKEVVVYGLDADLIVLSLLAVARVVPAVRGWRLLRELAEFERGAGVAAGGVDAFGTLNVMELLRVLVPARYAAAAGDWMLDYVCGMSLLGNDFLPHSLSVKMREGGHDVLVRGLADVHAAGERLVEADGSVRWGGVAALVRSWAESEEAWIVEAFLGKYKGRGPPPRNEREKAMQKVENLPMEWREETAVWKWMAGSLLPDWRETYQRRWLRGAAVGDVCAEYLRGLQWILNYYLGKPVSYSWYYPWNLPPLWSDIVEALEGAARGEAPLVPAVSPPVAPVEQLAMVLPMDSWWLVRGDAGLRGLPARAPVYWPSGFGFFSVGKRWLWECEAEVPILTAARMRTLGAGGATP